MGRVWRVRILNRNILKNTCQFWKGTIRNWTDLKRKHLRNDNSPKWGIWGNITPTNKSENQTLRTKEHLEEGKFEKDKSEKGQFRKGHQWEEHLWKGSIWKRTGLKKAHLKHDNSKQKFWKGLILKRTLLKRTWHCGQHGQQVRQYGQQVRHCGQLFGHCGQHGPKQDVSRGRF